MCEICGTDASHLFQLPRRHDDFTRQTVSACIKCAKKSGVFCEKHNEIHASFKDCSTACKSCVKDRFNEIKWRANKICNEIKKAVSETEFSLLRMNVNQSLKHDHLKAYFEHHSILVANVDEAILFLVINYSLRKRKTEADVIKDVFSRKKAKFLIDWA